MALYIPLSAGKRFQMGKGDSQHLVSPDIGARHLTMNYSVFQPGHEFPQHIHDASADIFIVLEGGVSVRQGDNYLPIRDDRRISISLATHEHCAINVMRCVRLPITPGDTPLMIYFAHIVCWPNRMASYNL